MSSIETTEGLLEIASDMLEETSDKLAAMTAQRDQLLAVCKDLLQFDQRIMACSADGGKAIADRARAAIASIEKGQGI